jgi:hypothetical protein
MIIAIVTTLMASPIFELVVGTGRVAAEPEAPEQRDAAAA